jgi:cyclohexa-1,5-dienecarbonyl-CoA hydratase
MSSAPRPEAAAAPPPFRPTSASGAAMSDTPVKEWLDRDGRVLRLRLARPKANILDASIIRALRKSLADHLEDLRLKAVLLDHEGPHFSFGASIQEHMPDEIGPMLRALHALLGDLLDYRVPILVAVRGQCLGGGLELASACGLMFVAPDAQLGQPEILIGVFAPAASCILPERLGQSVAEDILLSGRSLGAEEARALGLVTQIALDPEAAAFDWIERHLLPKSAVSLRFALQAARRPFAQRVKERFAEVERLCLEGLMGTHDATEGLIAFMERRQPNWEDR